MSTVRFAPRGLFLGDRRHLGGQVCVQKAKSKREKVHWVFHNDHGTDIRSKSTLPVGPLACQTHIIIFHLFQQHIKYSDSSFQTHCRQAPPYLLASSSWKQSTCFLITVARSEQSDSLIKTRIPRFLYSFRLHFLLSDSATLSFNHYIL